MIKEITKEREAAMHFAMDVFFDGAVMPLLEKMYREDHKLLKDTYCLMLESFDDLREQYHCDVNTLYLNIVHGDTQDEADFWIFKWPKYKALCLDVGRVCNERGIDTWTDLDEAVDYFVEHKENDNDT